MTLTFSCDETHDNAFERIRAACDVSYFAKNKTYDIQCDAAIFGLKISVNEIVMTPESKQFEVI